MPPATYCIFSTPPQIGLINESCVSHLPLKSHQMSNEFAVHKVFFVTQLTWQCRRNLEYWDMKQRDGKKIFWNGMGVPNKF